MKIASCLLALAAAAPSAVQKTAQDDSQSAQSQDAQDQGYGLDQGGYGQQSGYEAEPAMSYGTVVAPKICVTSCPREAPCQHPGGGCAPKSCGGEVHYGAPIQSYGAQQSDYRRLQDDSQGAHDQGGYGQAQQSYGGPVYSAPVLSCGCPFGTKDTSGNILSNNWILWVGFALLFIPALWFMCFMFGDLTDDGMINGSNTTRDTMGMHRIVAGFICVFASLAYLTMATGHGYITRCCDGRSFFYARYIDWTLTTPLMIWELSSLARQVADLLAAQNGTVSSITSLDMVFLLFMDVLMIIGGLIGSLICGGSKWVFFGFSMLAFIPILTTLCSWDNTLQNLTAAEAATAVTNPTGGATPAARLRNYRQAMNITAITWFFYPVVWILAEGTGTIGVNAEAICYTVLDVLSKSVFGFIIVRNFQSAQ